MEASEVVKGRTNDEASMATKIPGVLGGNFVVNDYRAANEAKQYGIKVEGAMEVFPGRDSRGYGGLVDKI